MSSTSAGSGLEVAGTERPNREQGKSHSTVAHKTATPCVTFRLLAVSLQGPGQSPLLPFACCVGLLLSVGRCSCWCHFRVRGAQLVCWGGAGCGRVCRLRVSGTQSAPLCDIPSGCCSFTGPWTVTRSSLRMLRRVATFCRPLRPVLLLVSFPRSRSPVVGVLGLCWMRHGVPFACQRRPIVGVLRMCWLLPGSFDCFCCPHTSVHRPSIACLAVFLCGPGAFLHALSGPSTICPFPPHGWSAPDGLPLLLRKQPIWAAGDTPHLMPVEQGTPPPPGQVPQE